MSRFLAALGLLLAASPVLAAPAVPPPGSLVVGIKQPTAAIARAVAAKLPATVLQMERTGAYLVVMPKKGVTAATLAKLDPRISHVEPIVEMGATFRMAREAPPRR